MAHGRDAFDFAVEASQISLERNYGNSEKDG